MIFWEFYKRNKQSALATLNKYRSFYHAIVIKYIELDLKLIEYQNNYNISIFHSLYKINQYIYKGIMDYLLIYGDKELDSNSRNNIYNITLQINETMNFYEGLIRNISTSISIILDKIINILIGIKINNK